MFPGVKEFSSISCPQKSSCILGGAICPFSHSQSGDSRPDIPKLAPLKKRHQEPPGDDRVEKERSIEASPKKRPKPEVPRMPLDLNSRVPWKTRQASLEKIHAALLHHPDRGNKSYAVEMEIYKASRTKQAYASSFAAKILALRKAAQSDVGHQPSPGPSIPIARLREMVHDCELLRQSDYVLERGDAERLGGRLLQADGARCCARCGASFFPSVCYSDGDVSRDPCRYHFGPKIKLGGERLYSCCHQKVGEPGCIHARYHVFYSVPGFEEFEDISKWKLRDSQLDILAIDAEMVYTKEGYALARVSAVDWSLRTVLDVHVRPTAHVVDYNSRFSGITEEHFSQSHPAHTVVDFCDLYPMLHNVIGPHTILVGHSLENDLIALRLITKSVIDTSILFPHPTRAGWKQSLKNLCKEHLGEFVQEGLLGHDSVQDACCCMKLLRKEKFDLQ